MNDCGLTEMFIESFNLCSKNPKIVKSKVDDLEKSAAHVLGSIWYLRYQDNVLLFQ